MANHGPACTIPALPIVMESAGIGLETAEFVRLRRRHTNTNKPSAPIITKVLNGLILVSKPTAEAMLLPLEREIAASGNHYCADCGRILYYNCRLANFGSFINHLQNLREYRADNVLEIISYSSAIPYEALESHADEGTTLPKFAVMAIRAAIYSRFGSMADRWGLVPDWATADECKPLESPELRALIHSKYVREHCSRCLQNF